MFVGVAAGSYACSLLVWSSLALLLVLLMVLVLSFLVLL